MEQILGQLDIHTCVQKTPLMSTAPPYFQPPKSRIQGLKNVKICTISCIIWTFLQNMHDFVYYLTIFDNVDKRYIHINHKTHHNSRVNIKSAQKYTQIQNLERSST